MDIGSLVIAALLSLGLIGTDAVLNAGTIRFDVQVTKKLEESGYTAQIVDSLLEDDMRQIIEFRSIMHPAEIRSANQKSIITVLSEAVRLDDLTTAFQSEFGLHPVRLTGSLMADDKDPKALRFILAGQSRHTGEFYLDVTNRSEKGDLEPLPQFLASAAGQIVQRVEPYAAALAMLHGLRRRELRDAKDPDYIALRDFAQSELTKEIGYEFDASNHAAFHNLIGLADLLAHDGADAAASFQRSAKADPSLGVPLTNLALQYVSEGRFDDAFEAAAASSRTQAMMQAPFSLANAYTVMGLALWGKKDLPGAAKAFLKAVKVYPNCFWAYYYWSALLAGTGHTRDAEVLRDRAEMALGIFENYPESALMYFRVLPEQGFALRQIDFGQARHIADLEPP